MRRKITDLQHPDKLREDRPIQDCGLPAVERCTRSTKTRPIRLLDRRSNRGPTPGAFVYRGERRNAGAEHARAVGRPRALSW